MLNICYIYWPIMIVQKGWDDIQHRAMQDNTVWYRIQCRNDHIVNLQVTLVYDYPVDSSKWNAQDSEQPHQHEAAVNEQASEVAFANCMYGERTHFCSNGSPRKYRWPLVLRQHCHGTKTGGKICSVEPNIPVFQKGMMIGMHDRLR